MCMETINRAEGYVISNEMRDLGAWLAELSALRADVHRDARAVIKLLLECFWH
jgi:hypothetical protein